MSILLKGEHVAVIHPNPVTGPTEEAIMVFDLNWLFDKDGFVIAGVGLGRSYGICNLFLEIIYHYGFIDINESNPTAEYMNRSLILEFGIGFKLK